MSPEQLTLTVEAPVVDAPSGSQHKRLLVALYNENGRGLNGEEAAQRCGIRLTATATTRLEEMSKDSKQRERFPVPLVAKDGKRPTASGRPADVWFLTDAGREAARIAMEGS